SLRVHGMGDVTANITLVRLADGAPVMSWTLPAADNQVVTVGWGGLTQANAAEQNGRYAFRLSLTTAQGQIDTNVAGGDPDRDAFDLYGYIFPVRGAHNFGQSQARFGAGRNGHTHQGQDVMAKCGVPLFAARGGIVRESRSHPAAGNFVVIDADFTDVDNAYMHLAQPSPFKKGDQVFTGQQIGVVGRTGDASACHLHFEQWTGPGWYKGGKPFDPLPDLLAWDAIS
ncbi:MAG: M23 family metallopeptidase, partial [Thermoleophilaceae bacterium]|nr:M23 family metallopeptidase [Thermoleophilaceae bacterium]